MSKTLKSIILSALAFLSATAVMAQDDGTRRAINEIKRSPNYFYAEATLPTPDEATEAANVLLASFINDYVKDNNIQGVARVTSDNLEGVQYKSMKRGDNTRMFAYVHRSVYIPNYQEPDMDITIEEQLPDDSENLDYYSSSGAAGETSAAVAAPQAQAVQASGTDGLTPLQRQAINELVGSGDLQAAVKRLAKLRSENIVKRYGTMRDCRNSAGSNWIIAESNPAMTLTAILGPGADTRRNYMTGGDDSLGNYSGYNAVWFEF